MLWTDLANGEFSIGYVNVNGIRTRCLSAGSGGNYPLIFLHGSGGHLEAYQRNILPHAKHMQVFAIDMLGHGFTDKPDHDFRRITRRLGGGAACDPISRACRKTRPQHSGRP